MLGRNFLVVGGGQRALQVEAVVVEVVVRVDLADAGVDHSPVEEDQGEGGHIQHENQAERRHELPLVRVV